VAREKHGEHFNPQFLVELVAGLTALFFANIVSNRIHSKTNWERTHVAHKSLPLR
jgi:hypothetical protein